MANVEHSIWISRAVEEVFAYVVDPNKIAEWAGPVVRAKKISAGPVGLGTTSTRVTQFLGRTMEATYEITEYEPNRLYGDKTTSGPVAINTRILFSAGDGGAKVTVHGEIEANGFFKLAEPILSRMSSWQLETDLQTLKDLLEAR